jgi:hypothetical protein
MMGAIDSLGPNQKNRSKTTGIAANHSFLATLLKPILSVSITPNIFTSEHIFYHTLLGTEKMAQEEGVEKVSTKLTAPLAVVSAAKRMPTYRLFSTN